MSPIPSEQGGSAGDIALDQKAVCKRYGRTSMTFRRWRKDHGAPAPSFYIAGNPYWWLSVLQAWEHSRPAQSRLAGKTPSAPIEATSTAG
jgi:hypothetical protein